MSIDGGGAESEGAAPPGFTPLHGQLKALPSPSHSSISAPPPGTGDVGAPAPPGRPPAPWTLAGHGATPLGLPIAARPQGQQSPSPHAVAAGGLDKFALGPQRRILLARVGLPVQGDWGLGRRATLGSPDHEGQHCDGARGRCCPAQVARQLSGWERGAAL
jgi:hypothetical protein